MPNLQAVFNGRYEIIPLEETDSLHHGLFLPSEPLQAFAAVSLRRLMITSMILAIKEATE
jgi:hypothetical protein